MEMMLSVIAWFKALGRSTSETKDQAHQTSVHSIEEDIDLDRWNDDGGFVRPEL
jgi:hypothetical protein